jgi:uncharacterized membrane protein
MQPDIDGTRTVLSLDTKVILMALATALLTAAGVFFQKLNGARAGNVFMSGWLLVATACFLPTFLISNKVFLMGGRMSLYVPLTAVTYVLSIALGHLYFAEAVPWGRWVGCGLIVVGVAVTARG